jgi:hypothetical protein
MKSLLLYWRDRQMLIRRQYLVILALVMPLATVFQCWTDAPRGPEPSLPGPQTMEQVVAVAQNLGLHYRSDRADGVIDSRLIVSEAPVTLERAVLLSPARLPEDPQWFRTVAVYRSQRYLTYFPGVYELVAWGSFFLYGDPSLIKRLTRQTSTRFWMQE